MLVYETRKRRLSALISESSLAEFAKKNRKIKKLAKRLF